MLTAPRLRRAALVAAAVLALVAVPLSASALVKPALGPVRPAKLTFQTMPKLTLAEAARSGPAKVRAVADDTEEATEFITGRVGTIGGMREDASLAAIALYQEDGEWWGVSYSEVATDGTYTLPIPPDAPSYPIDLRVVFFDYGNVYEPAFYLDAATVEDATDVPVSQNTTVSGIDQTLTAYPETMITGQVRFSGASSPTADSVSAVVYEYRTFAEEPDMNGWEETHSVDVAADGTFRAHLPATGVYRVGLSDYTDVFGDVFYEDADTVEDATDIPLTLGDTTSIEQTMVALPAQRISGDDRYETAVKASQDSFPDGGEVSAVVLASGQNWPDALVGGPLAAANWGPLLLTRRGDVPDVVMEELERLQPFEVVILGGTGAVSLEAEVQLRMLLRIPIVRRIAGNDRYDTAAMVAQEILQARDGWGEGSEDGMPVVVTTGRSFADAMSAAPLAGALYSPVLLTRPDALPPLAERVLDAHEISESVIVGGTGAVGAWADDALPNAERLFGADRYATAVAVAEYGMDEARMNPGLVGLASGTGFPDGLTAGAALGMNGRALLLTRPTVLSGSTASFLEERTSVGRVIVYGGEASVSPEVFEQVMDLIDRTE